ncbi:hypothetical protein HRbin22_02391 [Candidatus Thermoflexus japonica]|uniref:GlsB/YeaQ/YmgE family stress response membrane protein n=1 Tax=Candidatus Thermoflexus japonica TaxID=2035417 RepID=A0A2H5Y9I8_9CHLR|nr:hypothetical protein HRbin22_02391 [Candidatus Thermoflexus japonica]
MMWTTPALILFLGMGAGLLRHVAVGGGARRLMLDLMLGCLGFALGHGLGQLLAPGFGQIGTTAVIPGMLGAGVLLGVSSIPSRRR